MSYLLFQSRNCRDTLTYVKNINLYLWSTLFSPQNNMSGYYPYNITDEGNI